MRYTKASARGAATTAVQLPWRRLRRRWRWVSLLFFFYRFFVLVSFTINKADCVDFGIQIYFLHLFVCSLAPSRLEK